MAGRRGAKGLAIACVLVATAVGSAAAPASTLSGRTTQRTNIALHLRGGKVASIRATVSAGCNDGERIRRTVTLRGGPLQRGRFSAAAGSGATRVVVIGTVRGRSASGQLRAFFLYTLAGRPNRDGVVFCDTGAGSHLVGWSAGRVARAHAANVGSAYSLTAGCINYDPAGYHVATTDGDAANMFEIRAPSDGSADGPATSLPAPADPPLPAELPGLVRRRCPRRSHPCSTRSAGRTLPLRVFVAPDLTRLYGGLAAPLCDDPSTGAIVLASDYLLRGFSSLPAILAHELAHEFQGGTAGVPVRDNWFMEASAEYFASLLAPDPVMKAQRDEAFFGDPSIALDTFQASGVEAAHEYGAFRFVQWLALHLGTRADVYAFVREMIQRTARSSTPSASVTDPLAGILAARGQSFADDLGRFWAEHMLEPSQQPSGPTGRRVDPPTYVIDPGTSDVRFTAPRVAATFGAYHLRSDVRQVTFSGDGAGRDARFWVSYNGTLHDWSTAGGARFCVGRPSPGARRWPGEIRMGYVNAAIYGGTAMMPLRVDASTEPCVPDDPAPDEPYASLGGNCPPTPFAPPGRGQNASWVFLYLFGQVFDDMTKWDAGAFFFSNGHRRSLIDGERNFIRVLDCTADRASAIPARVALRRVAGGPSCRTCGRRPDIPGRRSAAAGADGNRGDPGGGGRSACRVGVGGGTADLCAAGVQPLAWSTACQSGAERSRTCCSSRRAESALIPGAQIWFSPCTGP